MLHGLPQHWTLNYLGRPQAVEFPPFLNFGVLTHKNAGQTHSTGFGTAAWQVEDYDVTGWHDNVTNNSQHIVPSGVALVRVQNNWTQGNRNNADCRLLKNGAVFNGMFEKTPGNTSANTAGFLADNLCSALVEVSASNFFQVQFKISSGTGTWNNSNFTWMSTEEVDASLRRCLVNKTATQALTSGVETALTWDAEIYDEGGWFTPGGSVFTVPTGVTAIRLTTNVQSAAAAGSQILRFRKGGASFRGGPICRVETNAADYGNMVSAVLEVTAGDTFDVTAQLGASVNVVNAENTWFCVEEVPSTVKRVLLHRNSGTHSVTNVQAAVVWQATVYDTDSMWSSGTPTLVTIPSGVTQCRASFCLAGGNVAGGYSAWVEKNAATFYGTCAASSDVSGSDFIHGMSAWVTCSPGDTLALIADTFNNRTIGTENESWFCVECR